MDTYIQPKSGNKEVIKQYIDGRMLNSTPHLSPPEHMYHVVRGLIVISSTLTPLLSFNHVKTCTYILASSSFNGHTTFPANQSLGLPPFDPGRLEIGAPTARTTKDLFVSVRISAKRGEVVAQDARYA
jgi:hypothetical protein